MTKVSGVAVSPVGLIFVQPMSVATSAIMSRMIERNKEKGLNIVKLLVLNNVGHCVEMLYKHS